MILKKFQIIFSRIYTQVSWNFIVRHVVYKVAHRNLTKFDTTCLPKPESVIFISVQLSTND